MVTLTTLSVAPIAAAPPLSASAAARAASPISYVGSAVVYSGHLGGALWSTRFTSHRRGDLEVLAVLNSGPGLHVSHVAGGGATGWRAASRSHPDPRNRRALQIWFATVSHPGRSVLQVRFSGRVGQVGVAVQEFHDARARAWRLGAAAWAPTPFPLLATRQGAVYVGLAVTGRHVRSGATAGFVYRTPGRHGFLLATRAGALGRLRPRAKGATSVAAILLPVAPRAVARPRLATTGRARPTTPTSGAPSTTTTGLTTSGATTTGALPPQPVPGTTVPPASAAGAGGTSRPGTSSPGATGAGSGTSGTTTAAPTTAAAQVPSTTAAPAPTPTIAPPTTAPPTTAPPTTAPPATAPPATGASSTVPPASLMPNSLFDKQAQSWPVDPSSAQYVSAFVSDYQAHYGTVGVNSLPVYYVPAGQPGVPLSVTSGCNNFLYSTGTSAPIPSYTNLNGSSDSPLVVYQPSSGRDWELWSARTNGSGGYSACWGGGLSMSTTSGVFPTNFGLSATGISYLATTITEADVASGSINHAIAVVLPRCNHFTYPANRGDCGSDPGQPAEGQYFRFAPGTTCPASECSTPFATMVFNAIKTYGMVVIDQGGAVMLEQEQPSDWAAEGRSGTDPITASWQGKQEYQVVANLPWPSLQAVDPPA